MAFPRWCENGPAVHLGAWPATAVGAVTASGFDVQLWDYVQGHAANLTFLTYRHASLAFQTVLVGTVVAVEIAVLVYRAPFFSAFTADHRQCHRGPSLGTADGDRIRTRDRTSALAHPVVGGTSHCLAGDPHRDDPSDVAYEWLRDEGVIE